MCNIIIVGVMVYKNPYQIQKYAYTAIAKQYLLKKIV